jgi:hypothetical protein
MIKNGIIITRNKVIDTTTGCGGSLEVCLSDDETGETIVWHKDLMEMVEEASQKYRAASVRRMKGSSRTETPRLRQYTMVVVDASNGEHTTFCGTVDAGVSDELIRECFEKRFGLSPLHDMHYYFDWEDQWESGDLCASVDFKS